DAPLEVVVLPSEDGSQGNGGGEDPNQPDPGAHMFGLPAVDVVDSGDGPEPVTRNGQQVEDAGSAAEHIYGREKDGGPVSRLYQLVVRAKPTDEGPDLAQGAAHPPLLGHLVDGTDGHDQTGNQEIGDCQ